VLWLTKGEFSAAVAHPFRGEGLSFCQSRPVCGIYPPRVTEHGSRITSYESLCYPAISRFCANGHSPSIHCASQRNPVRAAISGISSA